MPHTEQLQRQILSTRGSSRGSTAWGLRGIPQSSYATHELQDYARVTSIKPVYRILSSKSYIVKLIWMSVMVFGLIITVKHLSTVIQRYFNYPTQISLQLKTNESFVFPAVTICNLCPLRASKLKCSKLNQLVKLQSQLQPAATNHPTFQKAVKKLREADRSPIEFLQAQEATKFMMTPDQFGTACTKTRRVKRQDPQTAAQESRTRIKRQSAKPCADDETLRFCHLVGYERTDVDDEQGVLVSTDDCAKACKNRQRDKARACAGYSVTASGQCRLWSVPLLLEATPRIRQTENTDYYETVCVPKPVNQFMGPECNLGVDHVMFKVSSTAFNVQTVQQCMQRCAEYEGEPACHAVTWYSKSEEGKCLLHEETSISTPRMYRFVADSTVYIDFGFDGETQPVWPDTPAAAPECCDCCCCAARNANRNKTQPVVEEEFDVGAAIKAALNGTTEEKPPAEASAPHGMLDKLKGANKYDYESFLTMSTLDDLADIGDLISITPELARNYGVTMDDTILECTFDRSKCKMEQWFSTIVNNQYGNCFTFNSKRDDTSLLSTRKNGADFGLRLTLNINASEYVGLLASGTGIRVTVHSPHQHPMPHLIGFDVKTGRRTTVSVTQKEMNRLSKPYSSNCTSTFPDEYKPFLSKPDELYTVARCEQTCVDYHLWQNCKCAQISGAHHSCDVFDGKQRKCLTSVTDRLAASIGSDDRLQCDCGSQCKQIAFQADLSHTLYPSRAYQALKVLNFAGTHRVAGMMMDRVIDDAQNQLGDGTSVHQLTSDNLLRLHVHLKSMTIEITIESPSYPWSNLLADVGSIVGSYMGLTCVALVEVTGFFWNVSCACLKDRRDAYRKAKDDQRPLTVMTAAATAQNRKKKNFSWSRQSSSSDDDSSGDEKKR